MLSVNGNLQSHGGERLYCFLIFILFMLMMQHGF